MPIVTLRFNLPEEQSEFDTAINAAKAKSMLWYFAQQLRSWQKHGNDFKDADDALDKIREEFYRLVNEHGVELD